MVCATASSTEASQARAEGRHPAISSLLLLRPKEKRLPAGAGPERGRAWAGRVLALPLDRGDCWRPRGGRQADAVLLVVLALVVVVALAVVVLARRPDHAHLV